MVNEEEQEITLLDITKVTGESPQVLRTRIKKGQLKAVKRGKEYKVTKKEFRRYLREETKT